MCVCEREKKEKKKKGCGDKLTIGCFLWPIYLPTFSIISMERNFREEEGWWKKKIFGSWKIRLWRVVGMRSWGIFGKEGKSER